MREIKFRVWDKENGSLVSDIDLRDFGQGQLLEAVNRGAIELMQFTGLKDKNGKEIYEGDILQNQAQAIREVKRTKYGEYKLFIGKHSNQFWKGWIPNTVWEIIGNVYETPKLLGDNHDK